MSYEQPTAGGRRTSARANAMKERQMQAERERMETQNVPYIERATSEMSSRPTKQQKGEKGIPLPAVNKYKVKFYELKERYDIVTQTRDFHISKLAQAEKKLKNLEAEKDFILDALQEHVSSMPSVAAALEKTPPLPPISPVRRSPEYPRQPGPPIPSRQQPPSQHDMRLPPLQYRSPERPQSSGVPSLPTHHIPPAGHHFPPIRSPPEVYHQNPQARRPPSPYRPYSSAAPSPHPQMSQERYSVPPERYAAPHERYPIPTPYVADAEGRYAPNSYPSPHGSHPPHHRGYSSQAQPQYDVPYPPIINLGRPENDNRREYARDHVQPIRPYAYPQPPPPPPPHGYSVPPGHSAPYGGQPPVQIQLDPRHPAYYDERREAEKYPRHSQR